MLRRDDVQVRMEIDGKQAISELGKQELAAYEYRQEIKQIKEEQAGFERESKKLDKIRERYEKLAQRIKELDEAGKSNTKTYKRTLEQFSKVSKELASAEKATKDLAASQARYNEVSGKLEQTKTKISALREQLGVTGMTMRQLRKYQADLTREMDVGTTRGTARYEELKQKLKEVNAAIAQQRSEVNGSASAWAKIKTEISKFGMLALGYLGAQEIIGRIGNLVKGAAELSDALSDVQKTTGMSNAEAKDLAKTLGTWNTRTARKELLGMAEIAGRLGIQGKKDIEGFVKAADMVNVALGDSLGDVETVMRELGKLTSTYNIKEAYGIEESLLRVGSALNELGMASTANEGNIVDFTKRMGGIAPLAKITIQDIMGLGATLDSLGQTSEVSSTALSKLFINMAKNAEAYAKFAKMEVKDFVDLMNKDANEAFLRVLEGVKDNSNGITELAESLGDLGEDGGRVIGVLGTLANNIKLLRDQQKISNQAFKEGTSIWEEFQTKNENLAAAIAKVQKWINEMFVNSAFTAFLDKSVGRLADWATGIDKATRAFQSQDKYVDMLGRRLPDLMLLHDQLKQKTNLNAEEQEELRTVIQQLAELVPTAITEFDKYGRAIAVSTDKVHEFSKAQMAARKVLNADAIKEQQSELKYLEGEIQRVNWALSKRDEQGDLFKVVQSASGLTAKSVKLTADEISNLQKRLAELSEQRLGRIQILEDLQGLTKAQEEGRAAFLSGAGTPPPTENPDGGGDKGLTEEQKAAIQAAKEQYQKLVDEFKNYQKQIDELEQQQRLSRLDRDSREVAEVEMKYGEMIGRLKGYRDKKVITEAEYNEIEKGLLGLQNEEIEAVIKTHNDRVKEERQKIIDDIGLITMEGLERELFQEAKKFDQLIELAKKYGLSTVELEIARNAAMEEVSTDYKEKQGKNLANQYDQVIQQAKSAGLPILEYEKAKNDALLKLQQGYNEKWLAADLARLQRSIEEEVKIADAKAQIQQNLQGIFSATIDIIGKKQGEYTGFQKALALAQVAIDTGASLAKIIPLAIDAAKDTGPAAPFVFAAYITTMTATVLSAIARAKNAISEADTPEWSSVSTDGGKPQRGRPDTPIKKSYYYGGPTGSGMGFGDQYGEYAGYVHKREYVIPEAVRAVPVVKMQIEPLLESLRMRWMGRGFYTGGPTEAAAVSASPQSFSDPEIKSLLMKIAAGIDRFPRQLEVRGKWVYRDWQEMRDEIEDLEKRYRS